MTWSVLTSANGKELSVVAEIQSLGADAYCPITKHLTRPKRKSSPVEVTSAAFPGYLFVEYNFTDLSTTPILKLSRLRHLRLGDEFCTVTDDEIDRLRSEDEERCIIPDLRIKFHSGDHVRVLTGPMVGRDGTVITARGQRVQLTLVGFNVKIYMPAFSLKKIEATSTVQ